MTAAVRRPGRRRLALVGILASATVLLAGMSLAAGRAAAVLQHVTETGQPGYLSLRSGPSFWQDLEAGDAMQWVIEASLQDAEASSLSLELTAAGELVQAGAMTVAVQACDAPFQTAGPLGQVNTPTPTCALGGVPVLPTTSLAAVAASGTSYDLATLHRGDPRHLLVTLRLADTADAAAYADTEARFGVGLHAAGDSDIESPTDAPGNAEAPGDTATTTPSGADALARTGTGADLLPLTLIAIGLVSLGTTIALWRRMGAERLADTKEHTA